MCRVKSVIYLFKTFVYFDSNSKFEIILKLTDLFFCSKCSFKLRTWNEIVQSGNLRCRRTAIKFLTQRYYDFCKACADRNLNLTWKREDNTAKPFNDETMAYYYGVEMCGDGIAWYEYPRLRLVKKRRHVLSSENFVYEYCMYRRCVV